MKDIDIVCERLVVIDKGSIVIDDAIDRVKKTYGNMEKIEIKLKEADREAVHYPCSVNKRYRAATSENTLYFIIKMINTDKYTYEK